MASSNQRQCGRLDLAFELQQGITRPIRCAVQAPLQLSRVRYDHPQHPGQAALTLVHLGGILAGDQYDLSITLGTQTSAYITTAAATQVYRMPSGAASQHIQLKLAPHSRLDWLPEPTILFGGARFTQTTSITLGQGAQLSLLDVFVPGRLARGEVYAFEHYAMRLEVYAADGRLLVAERALLEPRRHNLAAPGMFGTTPVFGSLYLLGSHSALEAAYIRTVNQDVQIAATELPNSCGLLVRALGSNASTVRNALLSIWTTLDTEPNRECAPNAR